MKVVPSIDSTTELIYDQWKCWTNSIRQFVSCEKKKGKTIGLILLLFYTKGYNAMGKDYNPAIEDDDGAESCEDLRSLFTSMGFFFISSRKSPWPSNHQIPCQSVEQQHGAGACSQL
mmetsp:Transcript_16657/g.45758  ORF Transcript_16657/g.45758 Transcript_16657/m.45758 type:complete len:117 (-) Transcript_16657:307-657(-)